MHPTFTASRQIHIIKADNEVKISHRDALPAPPPGAKRADAAPASLPPPPPDRRHKGSKAKINTSPTTTTRRHPPPPGEHRAEPTRAPNPSPPAGGTAAARCHVTAEKRFTGLEVRNARLVFRSDPHSYICNAKEGGGMGGGRGREINGLGVPGRPRPRLPPCGGAGWRTRRPGAPAAAVRNKPPPPPPPPPRHPARRRRRALNPDDRRGGGRRGSLFQRNNEDGGGSRETLPIVKHRGATRQPRGRAARSRAPPSFPPPPPHTRPRPGPPQYRRAAAAEE